MLIDALPVAAHLARAARGVGDRDDGWVLGFHPVARMNPFQALLYSKAELFGFAPVGLLKSSDFDALEVPIRLGVDTVLHIHWTSGVLAGAESEQSAQAMVDGYLARLEALKEIGVRLVWSVHNVLPHHCEYPEVESRLRLRISDLADAIHVMAEGTPEAVLPHYRLPEEKIFEIPHPSYVGAYPDFIQRSTARFELGYERSNTVVGAVGSIQPYKGLSHFARAAKVQAESDPSFRALVAGIPGLDDLSRDLITELQAATYVDLIARKLGDFEVATVVTALDCAVLPYRASLNSGAALLALSFGVPIVAPNIGSFAGLVDRGFGIGYDAADSRGLSLALSDVRQFRDSFDRDGALEFTASLAGPKVSAKFFTALRNMLAGGN